MSLEVMAFYLPDRTSAQRQVRVYLTSLRRIGRSIGVQISACADRGRISSGLTSHLCSATERIKAVVPVM